MTYNGSQFMAAAKMFVDLLVSADIRLETMSEAHRGMALYSGDPAQVRTVDKGDGLQAYFRLVGKLRQISIDEKTYNKLIIEIFFQIATSAARGPITYKQADTVRRDPDARCIELSLTSRGTTSPEISSAVTNISDYVGYGAPQINIAVYDDGALDVWDRDSGKIYALDYEGKPDLPYARPEIVATSALTPALLSQLDVSEKMMCRFRGKLHYLRVSEETVLPVIENGVATGETFQVADTLTQGMEPPCYLVLTPDDTDASFDLDKIDVHCGNFAGIQRLSQYGSIMSVAGLYHGRHRQGYEIPGIESGQLPERGTGLHRAYPYFRMRTAVALGYGNERLIVPAQSWVAITRGASADSEPKLTMYTSMEMESQLKSGALIQTSAGPQPLTSPPKPA